MLALVLDHDAQVRLIVFLLTILLIGCWEIFAPRRRLSMPKWLRWVNNWSISTLNSILLFLVFPVLAVGVALLAEEHHWGLFNSVDLPVLVTIPLFIILFDLAIYWQHRIYHVVPLLWRLHRMHHSDPDFDVSTGIRFHPLSIMLSMLIKMLVVVALGPPPVAVLLAEIILNATTLFNHGNIYIPPKVDRVLRLFVVTPDMHRVHHSVNPEETNTNFGFNFPWWDRIFKTYRAQPHQGHETMEIGIHGFQSARAQYLDKLLIHPFLNRVPE